MRQLRIAMLVMVILSMGSGCAVIGRGKDFRPLEEKTLGQVTPGKTTAADVMRLFGPPSQIVKLTNGNAYIYNRSLSKATGLWFVLVTFANYDTQHDRIVFFLNNQDLVTHYGSSFKSDTSSHGLPF
ncbi:MAG: hypothetical protein C0394_04920 [Syntrophus sp. (in: bacteria)]|nr:hypothetical protein [Syntrophus sp. (in: bacteria)]